jgi:hypothetical protein
VERNERGGGGGRGRGGGRGVRRSEEEDFGWTRRGLDPLLLHIRTKHVYVMVNLLVAIVVS